jgi:hypothetical protein
MRLPTTVFAKPGVLQAKFPHQIDGIAEFQRHMKIAMQTRQLKHRQINKTP